MRPASRRFVGKWGRRTVERRHRRAPLRGEMCAVAASRQRAEWEQRAIKPCSEKCYNTQIWNYIVEMALSPQGIWHHNFTAISLIVKVLDGD